MIEKMEANLCIFPDDVRFLIHSFSDTATDEETRLRRIELIIINTVIVPAVSLPKSYYPHTPRMYFDMSPLGPTHVPQVVPQCFRFILHPMQAQD